MQPSSSDTDAGPQPLLPQIPLMWSFAAITASAILITLVRWAGQGVALVAAIVAIVCWLLVLFGCFALLFLITYLLGWLENLLAPPDPEVLSPFATDRMPQQIVVPLKSDTE